MCGIVDFSWNNFSYSNDFFFLEKGPLEIYFSTNIQKWWNGFIFVWWQLWSMAISYKKKIIGGHPNFWGFIEKNIAL